MEAHNGMSAKIVEEAGFKGIWASGLSISAALGVRDNNEASWTQVLEVVEFMSECTTIPILMDGDTGHGNFNNARRLIKKLESRGIAGVCLEDKMAPRPNSFMDGELESMADVDEFCGKIRACKDTQRDADFCVVARLEAMIAGYGVEEAVRRAEAYSEAGADAIMCHSKRSDASDINAFMEEWAKIGSCPVVIAPTKYWRTPTEDLEDIGVSTIIWSNHNMRSAIHSMQEVTRRIFEDRSLEGVEGEGTVVPVAEVFRLQNTAELKLAESKYENFHHRRPNDEITRNFVDPGFFLKELQSHGTEFFTGVPDSLLKDVTGFIMDQVPPEQHVIAANEGTAVGMAAGHHFATGKIPCVYMQNSGLGNAVNPLLSLVNRQVFSVPMLLLIGFRGEPGRKDEPQHTVQGQITPELLRSLNVAHDLLPDYDEGVADLLKEAYAYMEEHQAPFACLVKRRTFHDYVEPTEGSFVVDFPMPREEVLAAILDTFHDAAFVATTGFTSRELFEMRESYGQSHDQDFLMVGSMGHSSSIALGVALGQPEKQVVCIDGDGAALMHMGALHTIGKMNAKNLKHIIINNGMHDSVGGQPTAAVHFDFDKLAAMCGYASARSVEQRTDIYEALCELDAQEGPALLEIKVRGGARLDLGRPTVAPKANKKAFMNFLGAGEDAPEREALAKQQKELEVSRSDQNDHPKWMPTK